MDETQDQALAYTSKGKLRIFPKMTDLLTIKNVKNEFSNVIFLMRCEIKYLKFTGMSDTNRRF